MFYSFEYAAQITHLCIVEIRKRGLHERKILRKSVPNSDLFLKTFYHQICTADDLAQVDIHSVATLMQDILWCCQERMVPKKVWRRINYETCTVSSLSSAMTLKGEQLLLDILDFLVELMQYKDDNFMDAYHLGEAMGKVTLGPADCDPILAEKAGHFMTRMIIEHSKLIHRSKTTQTLRRIDSGFAVQHYCEYKPMSKTEATIAKAKHYNRTIKKIRAHADWLDNTTGLRAMLDNDYDISPSPPDKPWVSIFANMDEAKLDAAGLSPTLYRILINAAKPLPSIPLDPLKGSSLDSNHIVESAIYGAFDEFRPRQEMPVYTAKMSPLKKLNRSFSNLKIHVGKLRSRPELPTSESCFSEITEETELTEPSQSSSDMFNNTKDVLKKTMHTNGRLEPRLGFHSPVIA